MGQTYIIDSKDGSIISAAERLLWKIIHSQLATAEQVEQVAHLLGILGRLPAVSEPAEISVVLEGPTRWYGEHRISHWWEVRVERELIDVLSGGRFHQESTGSDAFTCMMWSAAPGVNTDYADYLDRLWLVDDAMPFEPEVQQMDLNETGYSLTVFVTGQEIVGLGENE